MKQNRIYKVINLIERVFKTEKVNSLLNLSEYFNLSSIRLLVQVLIILKLNMGYGYFLIFLLNINVAYLV